MNAPEPAALVRLADEFIAAASPVTRERVNVLSAAAAVVTQLPADELTAFVRTTSRLSVQMLELAQAGETIGRALRDYAEALSRSTGPTTPTDYIDERMPRGLDSGSMFSRPHVLPTDSLREHLVGAPSDEGNSTAHTAADAVEHEVGFLRDRCLRVLAEQIEPWVSTDVDTPPSEAARESVAARIGHWQANSNGNSTDDDVPVLDGIVPVEISDPRQRRRS